MKPNVHPIQYKVLAQCVCNNEFYFYTSLDAKVIQVEVCNKCHPFFTGKQQVVTTAGRVDSFNSKFNKFRDQSVKAIQAKKVTEPADKAKKVRKSQPKINKNKTDLLDTN